MSQSDNLRLLHTMIRVKDVDASLSFYCELLGMVVRRRADYEEGRFSLVYLGYNDETEGAVLELTDNWDDKDAYSHGSGYGHIAIGSDDIYALCTKLEGAGVNVTRAPGPMKNPDGVTEIVIAFIEDPDGYKIELIQYPFPPAT
jgi:lactoylglutathione lyase